MIKFLLERIILSGMEDNTLMRWVGLFVLLFVLMFIVNGLGLAYTEYVTVRIETLILVSSISSGLIVGLSFILVDVYKKKRSNILLDLYTMFNKGED